MIAKMANTMTYTQTKKKSPFFMVAYISIQLRCQDRNKPKMFPKSETHENGQWFDFIFLSGRINELNVKTAISIINRKAFVNVTHFRLNGSQNNVIAVHNLLC